jgi:DNA-binding response OmpR family regulator
MKAHILVVDDEPGLRSLLRMTLTRNGYEPVMVKDGQEALEVLGGQRIDLVISDVAMPGMNGYQLFEAVRSRGRQEVYYALLPFVFLTARGMDSDIRYGKSLGVDDYLVKPVLEADMVAIIEGKLRARKHTMSLLSEQRAGNEPIEEFVFMVKQHRVVISCAQHRIWIDDDEMVTSARAVFLLEDLARRPNRVVSIPDLVRTTHELETDEIEGGNLMRPLVRRIRGELKKYGLEECIQNVRGRGYMLVMGNSVRASC